MKRQNQKISNGVKNIFKKTTKFIFPHLIYLVIGIFLAVGATYVYATWDQAKTGGTGQLSEANWNELVTMIGSELSSINGNVDNAYTAVYVAGAPNCSAYPCASDACLSGYTPIGTTHCLVSYSGSISTTDCNVCALAR